MSVLSVGSLMTAYFSDSNHSVFFHPFRGSDHSFELNLFYFSTYL